jgi:hypothetical protein
MTSGAFALYENRMRPFVLMNQDMLSVERQTHIPDDIFEKAKNGISLDDLIPPSGLRTTERRRASARV